MNSFRQNFFVTTIQWGLKFSCTPGHDYVSIAYITSKPKTCYVITLLCFFVWIDSLRPIKNLSVKQGRVFLGWTSTKLG